MVSNVDMKGVGKDVAQYVNVFIFGVGLPGGAEAPFYTVPTGC